MLKFGMQTTKSGGNFRSKIILFCKSSMGVCMHKNLLYSLLSGVPVSWTV